MIRKYKDGNSAEPQLTVDDIMTNNTSSYPEEVLNIIETGGKEYRTPEILGYLQVEKESKDGTPTYASVLYEPIVGVKKPKRFQRWWKNVREFFNPNAEFEYDEKGRVRKKEDDSIVGWTRRQRGKERRERIRKAEEENLKYYDYLNPLLWTAKLMEGVPIARLFVPDFLRWGDGVVRGALGPVEEGLGNLFNNEYLKVRGNYHKTAGQLAAVENFLPVLLGGAATVNPYIGGTLGAIGAAHFGKLVGENPNLTNTIEATSLLLPGLGVKYAPQLLWMGMKSAPFVRTTLKTGKNNFRRLRRNLKSLEDRLLYIDEYAKTMLDNINKGANKIVSPRGDKTEFLLNYKEYNPILAEIHERAKKGDFDHYGDRVKNMFYEYPEYYLFCKETNSHPLDPNTFEAFKTRQLTSYRGVTAPDIETAKIYLTTTDPNRVLSGGDRLNTRGGLYTSNSRGIGDAFKNRIRNADNNNHKGYVAILEEPFEYPDNVNPATLTLEEKLKFLRDRIEIFGGPENPNATAIESPYVGRFIVVNEAPTTYERSYLPGKEPATPVQIRDIIEYTENEDAGGRWNMNNVPASDEFFIGTRENRKDFIGSFRRYLELLAENNPERQKYIQNRTSLAQQRMHDYNWKAEVAEYNTKSRTDKLKNYLGFAGIVTGFSGPLMGYVEYVKKKNREERERKKNKYKLR